MPPLTHHLFRMLSFFALLFAIGLVAALRERRRKLGKRR
jgi:hypothetical protein